MLRLNLDMNPLLRHRLKLKMTSVVLVIILLVAAVVRLVGLGDHPAGLQGDEASFLVNSQLLMQTGKDEDNEYFPLFLKSLIDPKPALYSYLQIPFLAIFPHDPVAASRMPGVLFGVGSIIFSYLIIKKLSNQKVALIVSALLALSPWHINVSRATQETIMSFFFITWSINLLLNLTTIEKNQHKKILSLFGFLLTSLLAMYSYHAAKIFLPLFTVGYLILVAKQKKSRNFLWLPLITVIISFAIIAISTDFMTRFRAIGFATNPQIAIDVTYQSVAATGHLPFLLIRTIYNKLTEQALVIAKNYFTYFSADFLFFFNQFPKKYVIPFQGLMLFCELPLLLFGFALAIKKKINWPFLWLVVAPIAGSLTYQEIPSMIRNFVLILPLLFLVSLSIAELLQIKKYKKLILFVVGAIYLVNWLYFFNQYWVIQPRYQPWYRNVAEEKLVKELAKTENQQKQISIYAGLTDIYLYLLLNGNISATQLQSQSTNRLASVMPIANYTLYRRICFPEVFDEQQLYVFDLNCLNEIKGSWLNPYLTETENGKISFEDLTGQYYLMKVRPELLPDLKLELEAKKKDLLMVELKIAD